MGHEQMVREPQLRAVYAWAYAHVLVMSSAPGFTRVRMHVCMCTYARVHAYAQVREAKLRSQHNKQRQQLKGFIRSVAAGGEYVGHEDLALAAQLAGMRVRPRCAVPAMRVHT